MAQQLNYWVFPPPLNTGTTFKQIPVGLIFFKVYDPPAESRGLKSENPFSKGQLLQWLNQYNPKLN